MGIESGFCDTIRVDGVSISFSAGQRYSLGNYPWKSYNSTTRSPMSSVCPKCGSSQIANDQCGKCGIVISKHRADQSSSAILTSGSISFVAPAASVAPAQSAGPSSAEAYSWKPLSIQETSAAYLKAKKRSTLHRNILMLIVALAVSAIGYGTYRLLLLKASRFSGYYWNSRLRFALTFPEKGWSHYPKHQMGSLLFKEAEDAFYRGGSDQNPGILMGIWTGSDRIKHSVTFDDSILEQMLQDLKEETTARMDELGFETEITGVERAGIGGSDGLVLWADLQKGDLLYETILYAAYDKHSTYTVQFIGKPDQVDQAADEIEQMMSTFNFRRTLI